MMLQSVKRLVVIKQAFGKDPETKDCSVVVLELIKLAAKQLHICHDHLVVWLQFEALAVMSFGQLPFTHSVMD